MEWIKAEDRLPELSKRVLIIIDNRWEGLGKLMGDGWYEYQSEGLRKATLNFSVTHWQRFPLKPNSDMEDERSVATGLNSNSIA